MKKIVVFLLLGFASFALIAGNSSYAADELVDLYPYDNVACLEATNECLNTKVGSSHWTMEYAGHRYHFVKGAARYAKDFEDDDSDGYISSAEMGVLSWNAFASLIINDTAQTVILETANARTDLTSVVHRKYTYFDELGQLQMFEDHISTFYITDDNPTGDADWRLATEAEITAYDAAEDPAVDTPNTLLTHIRMALDETDTDGYVIEPLGYLKWTNADVDTATAPVEDWSTIINGDGVLFDGNPDSVVIPAGWTVVSYGTTDRDNTNKATTKYITDMPGFMIDETMANAEFIYTPQPALFDGITALDDDAVTPGVNIVVDYNGDFDLDPTISASWLNMFDTEGKIISATEKLDYSVTISRDGTDLETIDFTYDEVENEYTASAPVTVIDSSEFGAGYTATWTATTPEADVTNVTADIVIGVMPPKYVGVEDRFINQSVYADLLEGITADDGYGNDKTSDIEVSYPEALNPYNPFPGEYQIDLTFTHNVFFAGIPTVVTVDGVDYPLDKDLDVNVDVAVNLHTSTMVFTDEELFRGIGSGYGSQLVKVSGGIVVEAYDRYNWNYTTSTGTIVGDANTFAAWQAAMTLAEGEFIVTAHGSAGTHIRDLDYGDPVTFEPGTDDFSYDIVTETSYTLTVDDMTAPILMVVNDNYSIYAGQYTSANAAILANVVAYDFTDAQDDLVKYVSINGGLDVNTPGTYTVEVTVEDVAGHTDVQSFDVEVKAAMLTEADVEALIEDNTLSAADVQALIDADAITDAQIITLIEANVLSEEDVQALIDAEVITEAQIQALIDASLPEPETGCGSAITGTSAIFVTFSLVLGVAGIFFFRRRR
ncbi:MAG: hypothetical protein WC219_03830 [Acholeplasmataceae bacterium]